MRGRLRGAGAPHSNSADGATLRAIAMRSQKREQEDLARRRRCPRRAARWDDWVLSLSRSPAGSQLLSLGQRRRQLLPRRVRQFSYPTATVLTVVVACIALFNVASSKQPDTFSAACIRVSWSREFGASSLAQAPHDRRQLIPV